METPNSSVSVLLLFPLALFTLASIALWLMLIYYMSKAGGWRELAQRHRLSAPFDGHKWRFCSGVFKDEVRYRGVMTVGANERGLYLAMMAPFSCCHPPILIPWKLVRKLSDDSRSRMAELELGESPPIKVNISPNVLRQLEREAPRAFA